MSRDFPDWVDSARAASGGRRFSGTMPLAWLDRLQGLLASGPEAERAEIDFRVVFDLDEQGQVRANTRVRGQVPLVCQRTLRTYQHALDSASTVAIVESEQLLESLPENYEPMVCADGRVRLSALVEEELLLALPLVPTSPDSNPVSIDSPDGRSATEQQPSGPFAVLEKLRKS